MIKNIKVNDDPPRTQHHMFCNFSGTDPLTCKRCKRFWEKYPYRKGEDIVNKYFPSAILRTEPKDGKED